jgi:uncharacterized membrane protein
MGVFQEQDSGGCRFVVRPNCALTWRSTKILIWAFAGCFAAVCTYFAYLGAWLVLPFAGLELCVLAGGFYLSALAGHTREVILIEGSVLRVLRGRRRLEEVARFPVHWTRVVLRRHPRGWYPSRLLLGFHGKGLEVGSKLVEVERKELALRLQARLGDRQPPAGRPAPVAAGLTASEPAATGGLAVWSADAHRIDSALFDCTGAGAERFSGCALRAKRETS